MDAKLEEDIPFNVKKVKSEKEAKAILERECKERVCPRYNSKCLGSDCVAFRFNELEANDMVGLTRGFLGCGGRPIWHYMVYLEAFCDSIKAKISKQRILLREYDMLLSGGYYL